MISGVGEADIRLHQRVRRAHLPAASRMHNEIMLAPKAIENGRAKVGNHITAKISPTQLMART